MTPEKKPILRLLKPQKQSPRAKKAAYTKQTEDRIQSLGAALDELDHAVTTGTIELDDMIDDPPAAKGSK